MGLFRKKKKQFSRELHSERYQFEYVTLPSIASFAPLQLFCVDYQGNELLNFLFDKDEKATEWGKCVLITSA